MEEYERAGLLRYTRTGTPTLLQYADEMPGVVLQNIWTDIPPVNPQADERTRYPTQKPLALLERIIAASTNRGDVVLDPFCGCGTAIEAAEKLGRKWIGIDITYLAIHVIEQRLQKTFGPGIASRYKLFGKPEDSNDARVLAARDWLEFQKWAVLTLGGLPKEKPGPDGGIDGIIRYHRVGIEQPNRAVVSVKGGTHVGVDAVHKLKSVVKRESAEMGVLVCLDEPSDAMIAEAASEGDVGPRSRRVAKLQLVTVDMLFGPNPIEFPGMIDPPDIGRGMAAAQPRKRRKTIEGQAEMLLPITGQQTPEQVPQKRPNRAIRPVDIEVTRAIPGRPKKAS
jgi:hypothetical protein